MQQLIDINADLGEGFGFDKHIMPMISSCSIACGGHFGDETTIVKTLQLAKKHNVKVGAHPSYADKENFGRKIINTSETELKESLLRQLRLFLLLCENEQVEVNHVKLHGALYNQAVIDEMVSEVVVEALKELGIKVKVFAPYNSVLHHMAAAYFPIKFEAFIDRRYNENATLVSRTDKNALITVPETVWKQLFQMYTKKSVNTLQGKEIPIIADTFCLHGDQKNTVSILQYIHNEMKKNNITHY